MDLEIKLISRPEHLSTSTLMSLLSKFIGTIEKSVFETFCEINKHVSRNRVQKAIYGKLPIEIDRVEKGSFILFLSGALAATIASCLYDIVKKQTLRKVSVEEVRESVIPVYSEAMLKSIEREIKTQNRFGVLYVNSVKSNITINNGVSKLSMDIDLGLRDKERVPMNSIEQIEFITSQINKKRERR